jgi:hypothetical protein
MMFRMPKKITLFLFVTFTFLNSYVIAQCPTAVSITSPITKFCPGGSTTLTANVTGGPNDLKYEWKNYGVATGGNTSTLVVTQAGFYTVKVTDTVNFCSKNAAGFSITVSPTTNITLSGALNFCTGTSLVLSVDSSVNYTFQWKDAGGAISGATYSDYTATTSGTYSVDVTDNSAGLGCTVTSDIQTVTVYPTSVGGTLTGTSPICAGAAAASLTLSGYTGSIIRWESSTNGGTSWSPIVNTTDTYNPGSPTQTTQYRAVVQSGTCASANSTIFTITVNPLPVAAINASGSLALCSGGSVTLSNSNGTSYVWKESGTPIGGATSSSYIANTAGSYTLTVTDANGCSATTSSASVVTVDPATVAGSVTGGSTICEGATSGTITLSGYTGAILHWLSSTNGGASWSTIAHTSNTYTSGSLNNNTEYKAIIQSGACALDSSTSTTVTVNATSVGGAVSGGSTICSGNTSSLLTLSGNTGNVQKWQYTTTPFSTWTDIANTAATYTSGNLTETTHFRAVVKSGVCTEAYSSEAIVIVNAAPSITAQPVSAAPCDGAAAAFSVTATGAISYQWKKGVSALTGETNSSLSFAAVSGTDAGSYSVDITNTCGTTTSNSVNLTVNSLPSATITPSGATTFCSGNSVDLSAPIGNTYQWKKNGTNESTSNPYTATTAGNYTVVVTDGNGCSATSGVTAITVNALPDASITVSSGTTNFCAGGSVTLSNSNGGSYQWKKNNLDTAVTTSSFVINSTGDYKVQVTDANGCVATTSTATTVTVDAPTVAGSITGGNTICEGSTSGVLTLSGNTGNVVSWESAVSPFSTWNSISHTATTYTSAALTATTQFRAVVQNGTCSTDNSSATTVTVDAAPVAGSVSGGSTICEGNTSGVLTLSGYTGTITKWQYAVSPFASWVDIAHTTNTYTSGVLTQTTRFRAMVGNGACTSLASSHTEVIVDAAINITAQPTSDIKCLGTSATFSVTATGTIAGYQWKLNGTNIVGATNSSYTIASITALDAGNYTVEVQSATCSNVLSSVASLTVNSATAPTIQQNVGTNPICQGSSANIRTSSSIYSGWQWKKDGSNMAGETNRNLALTLSGSYEVVITDGNGCTATSTAFAFVVNPLPNSSISAGGSTNICNGSNVTLSNAETGTFQWIVGGSDIPGANTNSYNATASGNYTIRVTSAAGCQSTTATPITVTVSPATVGGGVTGASTTICSGSNSPLLTLAGQTGTVTRWESSVSPFSTWTPIVNTNATYTSGALTQTTQFRAVVQSGACAEAASFEEEIAVTPPSVGGTVSGSKTICNLGSTGAMTLSGKTGNVVRWESSVSPFIVWSPIVNTTTSHSASSLTETTRYRAVVQNTALCAEAASSYAEIVVDNVPTFSVNPTTQSICEGSSVTFTATATSVNPITGYQWKRDGSNILGATSNSYTISAVVDGLVAASGDEADYTVVATNVCGNSAPSSPATLTVNSLPTASVSASGATTFCQGLSVDLTGSGSTAGYKWLKNGTQVSTANPYTASTSGNYQVVAENGFGCVDTSTNTTVLVNTLPDATITPSGATTFCSGGSVTLSNNNGTSYVWKESGTPIGGATTNSHLVNTSGSYTVTVTDANGCSATTGTATNVTVDAPTVAGSVTGGTVKCQGSNSGILTLAGNTGSVVRWESAVTPYSTWNTITNTATTYTSGALTQTTAFRAVVQNGTCLALESDTTITTVDPSTVGGTVSGGTTICEGATSGTLTLAGHTGNIVRWESSTSIGFASPTVIANTNNTYTSGALATSTYFRAVVKSGVCNEQNSASTLVTVINAPIISAQPSSASKCVGASITFNVIATGATAYQWRKGGVNIPSATSNSYTIASISLSDDADYDVVVSNTCVPTTTSSTVHLTVNALPIAGITPSGATTFCSGQSVSLTASGGTSYQWRKNTTNVSVTNPYVATTSGSYDVIATDANGCVSAPSTAEVVTVNSLPDASITPSGATNFCAGGNVTLSNTNGVTYQWKKNGSDTAITSSSLVVNSSGDYKVQVTDANGCVATTATATTVTVDAPTVAGSVTGGTTICEGSTSGVLTLSGNTGNVTRWESAVSPFIVWNTISNTATTYTSAALTATTQFRAVVKNGTCSAIESAATTVTVNPASVGGTVSGGTSPICTGSAPGTLSLSGETGNVVRWESAISPFATWNTIANVTTTETPGNLTATTRFRAVVKNGVCSEINSAHQEIVVNPLPSITAQPVSVERCVNGTVTFSVTATNATGYQWKKGGVNISGETASSITLNSLTALDADDYSVEVTNTCGSITSNNATLTINSLPTAGSSAGGPTTFCSGSDVSLTATGGTTYQWRKDGTNTATSNPLVVTTSGSYDVYAISNKGCQSASPATAIVVTVNTTPTADISPAGTVAICTSSSQLLTASGGTTYQWKKDGIDVATGTTYSATAAGSYTVIATNGTCSSAASAATVISITPAGTWLGTVDSDPSNTANWSCGTIPTASTAVTITSGNNPTVSAGKSIVANGITIGAGKTITVSGGTLRIRGSISGTGTINNTSGEVEFFGITDQTIPSGLFTGNAATKVKISNTGTVTLGGPLRITEQLTCDDGVFATGGNLTLASTASGTAIVAEMGPDASITGNVTVERYIPSSQRRWRFMAAPTSGGTLANWYDDIYITGTGGATNGFDATSNNSPSLYYYNEATTGSLNLGWTAAPNISMAFTVGKGYRVFVRGDRSDPTRLTGVNTTQNAVTIDVSGTLNQQYVTMPVTFTSSGSLSDDGWNLLGNPYAAPFDWGAMWRTGNVGYNGTFYSKISPDIYVYDPAGNNYKTYNAASASGTLTGGIIAPGQAFFAKATGTSPSLQFYESFKSTSSSNSLFKTGSPTDELMLTMRSDSFNYDQFIVKFKANATNNNDLFDIGRMNNGTNDIYSYGKDNIPHSLDARPLTTSVSDTIKLYTGGTNGIHTFTFNNVPTATGINFYLKDNYLNSTTPIIQNNTYSFTINSSNAATFGNNRFRIVIENTSALPVTISAFTAKLNAQKKAQLTWTTAQEKNSSHFEVEHSLDNVNFKPIGTVAAKGNTSTQTTYDFVDAGFVKGMVNYYRLKQVDLNNTFTYSSIRQVTEAQTIQSSINDYVYMAPIPTNDYIRVWSDVDVMTGGTEVNIYDASMRLVSTKTIHAFGKLNEHISLVDLQQGVYIIQLKDKNKQWVVTRKVVKN